jgi:UDP-N-acetylmuramoylalanine--D-glutamate ligase
MELTGKHVFVIGMGRTGIECARFLFAQGATVTVSDLRPESELEDAMKSLAGLPIRYFFGSEDNGWLEGTDYVIPSPGVPAENPLLIGAKTTGIPVLSEIALACRFCRAPLVAVTGTNGKSTTTTLIGEMFKASGRKVFVGGNLGTPFIGAVASECIGEYSRLAVSSWNGSSAFAPASRFCST